MVYKIAHVNNIWICIWTFSSTVNPSGWTEANFLWGARLNRKKIFHPEPDKFWNFYYINPKKMEGPVPPWPPQFRPPWNWGREPFWRLINVKLLVFKSNNPYTNNDSMLILQIIPRIIKIKVWSYLGLSLFYMDKILDFFDPLLLL